MATTAKKEQNFEEAFDAISLATWNRPRTSVELKSFVQRHHDSLVDIEV